MTENLEIINHILQFKYSMNLFVKTILLLNFRT